MIVFVGRMVAFVMDDLSVRPAHVTRVHSPASVNLQVIPDIDDAAQLGSIRTMVPIREAQFGNEPGCWRWSVSVAHDPMLNGILAPHAPVSGETMAPILEGIPPHTHNRSEAATTADDRKPV